MIRHRVILSQELKDSYSHLSPSIKHKIRACFRLLEQDPLAGKVLERELGGFRSYPIPPYRVVYRVDVAHRVVRVAGVGHRREIYEVLAQKVNAGEVRERRAIYAYKR